MASASREADEQTTFTNYERRFFGASYRSAEHRTPLSVWSLNASRNITSYPQELASLPAGSVQDPESVVPGFRINAAADCHRRADPESGLPANPSPVNRTLSRSFSEARAPHSACSERATPYMTMYYPHQEP
jgi:hypothetical protein